jgi:hypothetical protein
VKGLNGECIEIPFGNSMGNHDFLELTQLESGALSSSVKMFKWRRYQGSILESNGRPRYLRINTVGKWSLKLELKRFNCLNEEGIKGPFGNPMGDHDFLVLIQLENRVLNSHVKTHV